MVVQQLAVIAREAGAECCDTPDASPIQHEAASKNAWLMNGQTRSFCNCSMQEDCRSLLLEVLGTEKNKGDSKITEERREEWGDK